jgi:hypothetical protein
MALLEREAALEALAGALGEAAASCAEHTAGR